MKTLERHITEKLKISKDASKLNPIIKTVMLQAFGEPGYRYYIWEVYNNDEIIGLALSFPSGFYISDTDKKYDIMLGLPYYYNSEKEIRRAVKKETSTPQRPTYIVTLDDFCYQCCGSVPKEAAKEIVRIVRELGGKEAFKPKEWDSDYLSVDYYTK